MLLLDRLLGRLDRLAGVIDRRWRDLRFYAYNPHRVQCWACGRRDAPEGVLVGSARLSTFGMFGTLRQAPWFNPEDVPRKYNAWVCLDCLRRVGPEGDREWFLQHLKRRAQMDAQGDTLSEFQKNSKGAALQSTPKDVIARDLIDSLRRAQEEVLKRFSAAPPVQDTSQGMPEILDAYLRDGLYFGVVQVVFEGESIAFEFGIDLDSYNTLQRVLQFRPDLPNTDAVPHRHFFTGCVQRITPGVPVCFSALVQQGQATRRFEVVGPSSLVAQLLLFMNLKTPSAAGHLKRVTRP